MTFRIYDDFIKPATFKPVTEVKPNPVQQTTLTGESSKVSEMNFVNNANKTRLQNQLFLEKPTPTTALDKIDKLPKPDTTDKTAVRDFKTQRAAIADNAIKNSVPPNIDDYKGRGSYGNYEYQEAKGYYDSQITKLKAISAEAKRNPDTILSPGKAVEEINNLPQPDRSNPQSVKEYNDKRAQIAKDALLYATPPNRDDYYKSGLNGRTADYEYQEAKSYYDSSVKQLKDAAALEGSSSLLTPEEEKAATETADKLSKYIDDHQFGNLDDTNKEIAKQVGDLKLKYGDEAAAKMMAELYKKKPDDLLIALRLTDHMSSYDKQNIGKALGDAYGYLSADQKKDFADMVAKVTVADSFTTNVNFGKSTTLAELLSNSTNSEMKAAVVKSLMAEATKIKPGRFGDNGGVDLDALFKSAIMLTNSAPQSERAALLRSITGGLTSDNIKTLAKNNDVKDGLSKLFMESGKDYLHLIAPDGALSKADEDSMVKFMELTVFSEGNNSMRPKMMEYIVKLNKDVGDATTIPPVPNDEYAKTHGGWSKEAHVEVAGGFLAVMCKAAENQKGAIKADQEQQKKTVEMFTGLAFSFVPGAGKVLGELGGEGADYLEKIGGKLRDFAWDKVKGAAQDGVQGQLEKLISGDGLKDIDVMLNTVTDTASEINKSLPNGDNMDGNGKPDGTGNLNLRVIFQAAFAYYRSI